MNLQTRIISICLILLSSPAGAVTFTNVTDQSGIDYVQGFNLGNQASMTGGAAARDFDGDGWTDLFVTRHSDPPILYRNNGDGTFADVTTSAGLGLMLTESNGAAWGDVNNDGHPDLYVTSAVPSQANHLYINLGDGTFDEEGVVRSASIPTTSNRRFGTSVSYGDYDSDGWLDIHTNEWGFLDVVDGEATSHARLLRNTGRGFFEDTTVSAGVSLDDQYGVGTISDPGAGVWSFSSRFSDLDRDGHTDLVVASDFGNSRIYWNNGDGTFQRASIDSGFGTDENGMGLTVGDYNGDGHFDIFVTSIYHDDPPNSGHNVGGNYGTSGNRLYLNNGDRTFTDTTTIAGVRDGAWGWGTSFVDYDNDGDLDLAATNGFEGPSSDFFDDATRFWANNGDGTFADVAASIGITDSERGKGLLTFDYDNDGDLDLFIVNNESEPILYRNDGGNENAWLSVELEGTLSNRDGIGSVISVYPDGGDDAIVREVGGGSNYLSQNDILAHFGLGDITDSIDRITIDWDNGDRQVLRNVSPNQRLLVRQSGKSVAKFKSIGGVTAVPEPDGWIHVLFASLIATFFRRRSR